MSIPAETPLLAASSLLSQALSSLKSNPNEPVSSSTLSQLQLSLDILTKLDPYLDDLSSPPPASLKPLIEATATNDWEAVYKQGKTSFPLGAEFSAGNYQGILIAQIARALKAKNVLEVGMFTGTTTLCIAEQLKHIKDAKVVTLELDQYLSDFVRPHLENAGVSDQVEILIGQASQSLDTLKRRKEQFDLVFIDADKGGYKAYFDAILDGNLLRPGGVMLIDNTLYKGTPLFDDKHTRQLQETIPGIKSDLAQAVKEFNAYIRNDERVDVCVMPIRDGITWVNKK
ncbi:unnamed protein product [Sympodiomycopsis kandeliae]